MRLEGPLLGLGLALAPAVIAADVQPSAAVELICSAEHDAPAAGAERRLVMVSGVGTGGFAIATAKPEAQTWFNYGMALAHAFYHQDATAAFKRAREIDPDCAMCAWGEAWSEGPTLNFDVTADQRRAAGAVVEQAAALASNESDKNRALVAALKLRYAQPDAGAAADVAFAKAMDALSLRYPDDDEIAVLTSDAWLMLKTQHHDDQGVARSVAVLEPVLKRHPDNTGAIHFYIHATEVAGDPVQALSYADRLGALAPGSSHLVHMASHTFFRVGRYEDAGLANAQAIAVDAAYLRQAHDSTPQGKVSYHAHNLRFGIAGAMAAGDGPLAVRLADHAAYAFPGKAADDANGQMSLGHAEMAYGRFAPDRALTLADPGPGRPYEAILRHYARGEAFAARGDIAGVRAEAAQAQAGIDAAAHTRATALKGTPLAVARIAVLTLKGRAAMMAGQPRAAAQAYAAAVAIQDADLSYLGAYDPPPWWYPERRSLAAALLAAGDAKGAADQARTALKAWPHEPLTLTVLGQAERASGDTAGATRDLAEAGRTWRGGPMAPARI
jgi:tetratricopeptide (TPR) repeat protein